MNEPAGIDPRSLPLSTRLFALLRTLQLALIVMTLFFVALGEMLRHNRVTEIPHMLSIITGFAIAEAFAAVYFKQAKLPQAETVLSVNSEDRDGLVLARKWHVVVLAFCVGVSLYGFALRIMGAAFWQAAIFYGGGIALTLYCTPRKPE
jgi:hypothetical protein